MVSALRFGFLAAWAGAALGGRVTDLDFVNTLESLEEDAGSEVGTARDEAGANESSFAEFEAVLVDEDDEVDFGFMTDDLRAPGREVGFFGTIKQWFGSRATSEDVKDEIVQGHTCQKKGSRDDTYYASSLCYWLPEISDRSSKHPLLTWKGGKYPKGKALCAGLTGSGVCAKCSVCHNNARDEEGDIEKVVFSEQLKLPEGCMGEKEIERQCVGEFDTGSQELKVENDRCFEVEGRFNVATEQLNRCNQALQRLPQKIQIELPGEIQRAQQNIIRKEQEADRSRNNEQNQRSRMQNACSRYTSLKRGLRWQNAFLGATPTEQLLDMMSFHCMYPRRPTDNHDGSHFDEMARFNNQMTLYNACNRCDNAKDKLKKANSRKQRARTAVTRAEADLRRQHRLLAEAQEKLHRRQMEQPGLAQAKQAVDSEWLPQASGCQTTYSQYKNGKSLHVSKCAPTFYDSSCEKACIEVQARHAGCGVMEGDSPGAINGNGGIEATCAPPQPSWIMGPFTYGTREAAGGQCGRITKAQSIQYAQKILKAGWLWKKGRGLNGWDKRFFVLESADQVRSAILRYYKADPSKTADAEESVGKGIILWDAKGVEPKSGEKYSWKDGEECFVLDHFYRDYKLCVPSSEDPKANTKIGQERDEWVDLLLDAMTQANVD